MKKQLTGLFVLVLLCVMAVFPSFAKEARVVDEGNLLSSSEEADLTARLDEISERQKLDVIVVTVNGLEGKTSRDFADDYYDYKGYGYGAGKDGILLLVSMEDRDWYITTTGFGITAFTDAGIEYISEQFLPELSDGNYAKAFDIYAEQCDVFITQAQTGEPYDKGNMPKEPLSAAWIGISFIVGLIIALISVGAMKAQLKTVRSEPAANSYVVDGSMKITENRDFFLYRNVTRRVKPKDDDKDGSSTHTSSSGTTHGGGGGKF